MRGEKAGLAIKSLDMLRESMNLLILLLIWISPGLVRHVWIGLGWNGSPWVASIEFLLRKNVCLVRKWGVRHIRLTKWFQRFNGFRILVHGFEAGIGVVGESGNRTGKRVNGAERVVGTDGTIGGIGVGKVFGGQVGSWWYRI